MDEELFIMFDLKYHILLIINKKEFDSIITLCKKYIQTENPQYLTSLSLLIHSSTHPIELLSSSNIEYLLYEIYNYMYNHNELCIYDRLKMTCFNIKRWLLWF